MVEVVEDDEVSVEDIEGVGSVIQRLSAVLHSDAFKVAHGVERGVAVKAAVAASFACNLEVGQEVVQGRSHPSFGFQRVLLP